MLTELTCFMKWPCATSNITDLCMCRQHGRAVCYTNTIMYGCGHGQMHMSSGRVGAQSVGEAACACVRQPCVDARSCVVLPTDDTVCDDFVRTSPEDPY